MWQGHPILNEIRQGFKLRPATTIDKSKPIIVAEEEEVPTIRFVKPDKPADLSYLYAKKDPDDIVVWRPRSIVPPPIIHKGTTVPNVIQHSRPTTPNPPSAGQQKIPGLLKLGGQQPQDIDRNALLKSIQGGIKLKKTVTKDRSGLILDEEFLSEIQQGRSPSTMSMQSDNDTLDSQGNSQASSSRVSVETPIEPEPETKTVKRRKSSVKAVKTSPTVPKNFVPAMLSASVPPPPPPIPPMSSFGKSTTGVPPPPPPMPVISRPNIGVPPPPPPMPVISRPNVGVPPPPPPPPMSNNQPVAKATPTYQSRYEPKPKPVTVIEPEPEAPKCDVAFDEKNLYVTKENLEAEIKKGSASSRIAMFKQFEQIGTKAPMPRGGITANGQPGKLKIIENGQKDPPMSNGRLKINDAPTSPKTKDRFERLESKSINSLPKTNRWERPEPKAEPKTSIYSRPEPKAEPKSEPKISINSSPKKYSVPITVKTEEEPPAAITTRKKTNKKLSNGTLKKSPTKTKDTLSPTTTNHSLSPNSITSSAYQSGGSSPNSISSISPKSKSSGVSSATSSVSPPIRTTSINGSTREKTPPSYNPKTRSMTSERFSQLRQSFGEKSGENGELTLTRPLKKSNESGEQFWKSAVLKSTGVTTPTLKSHPVEIKTPWSVTTDNDSDMTTTATFTPFKVSIKKPPEVPPKRKAVPISIKISKSPSSYLDSQLTSPNLHQRYKFPSTEFGRKERPFEIVQR